MQVTLFYYFVKENPSYCTDTMTWVGELTNEQFECFLKERNNRLNDYDDIRDSYPFDFENNEEDTSSLDPQDEVVAFDEDEYLQEVASLDWEVLEAALPEWCEKAKTEILEDANNISDEVEEASIDDLFIAGCKIDTLDFDNGEDVKINLTYYVKFGRGDYSDDQEWDAVMPNSLYERYKEFVYKHPSAADSFETLEELFPEWSAEIYDKLVEFETDSFRENENPEDWGCEDDMKDSEWEITDTYSLTVRRVTFGKL